MKGKAILSSMLLGLTLPLNTFANAFTPTSTSYQNQDDFNPSNSIEIAQRYLTAKYVSSRLYNSESRILAIARQFSGKKVKWKSMRVNVVDNNRVWLNLYGRVDTPLKDSNLRIGLLLTRNSYSDFRFVNYDWEVWGGSFPGPVKDEVRRRLRNLPNYYRRFQQVLNRILA
ncbi:MAG: hypothetical protein F6K10_06760 [Moorea sp. SIO2B7]|nr:hypothetical protein [Moorena sp. SIO2B7]